MTDHNTHRAACHPSKPDGGIYLICTNPCLNIELMNRPLEDYLQKNKKFVLPVASFRGKEGCIMRFTPEYPVGVRFRNMTVAVSYLHAFPLEKIE